MFKNMYIRVKNTITIRKYLNPEDDAIIVTVASTYVYSSSKTYALH